MSVLTVGVDLAAEPPRTALARLDWSPGRAHLTRLDLGADDATCLEAMITADKTGIDCPLGWPAPFIDFITAHREGNVTVPPGVPGLTWRRALTHRLTDHVVQTRTGLRPLSPSADRIGHTTMRCAALLAGLASYGHPVDRRGTGAVAEVYPAASLKLWGLPHQGYKRSRNLSSLNTLVDRLKSSAPWLDLASFEPLCRKSDDALDAVICALTARAAALGKTTTPGPEESATAATEGWITLPTTPLADLAP
ncbi:DUF429 domain-containing protein [Nonomuraea sp. NPDC049421]|uniref:DUF429 domain-containing protein n=1 Tax=Nonomuraea sp. NPDC049421 TaxID=3155275 RepID=UPI0034439C2B